MIIIALALIIGLVLYSAFSWGYVSSVFYSWFILPVFPSLPHLTVLQFIGITIFLGTIIRSSTDTIKDDHKDSSKFWVAALLTPWLTLVLGWLIHVLFF